MLTKEQIVEILDAQGIDGEVKIDDENILWTRVTARPNTPWVRHGHVHDRDEAALVIDEWYKQQGCGDVRYEFAVGAVGEQEKRAEEVIRLLKQIMDGKQPGSEVERAIKRVVDATMSTVKKVADELLKQPFMLVIPGAPDSVIDEYNQRAAKTGIPAGLLAIIDEAFDDTPGECNCVNCLSMRVMDVVAPNDDMANPSNAAMLKFAAVKMVIDERYDAKDGTVGGGGLAARDTSQHNSKPVNEFSFAPAGKWAPIKRPKGVQ